jgi:hypothetical protein
MTDRGEFTELGGDIKDFWASMMTSSRPERPVQESRGHKRKIDEGNDVWGDEAGLDGQVGDFFDQGDGFGLPHQVSFVMTRAFRPYLELSV